MEKRIEDIRKKEKCGMKWEEWLARAPVEFR
jgi:hypothetical protein